MARAKREVTADAKPYPFMQVRVKLPTALHPTQPHGLGLVTDTSEHGATVMLLPTRHVSFNTVTLPHRSVAKPHEGYWEAYTPE